jgi:hypothetical protein
VVPDCWSTGNQERLQKSYAPLIPIPGMGTIGVEEGLFWVLQQEKWYHTGYVEWVASLDSR